MSEIDKESLREIWHKRIEAEKVADEQRLILTREAAQRAANLLRSKYQAQKVYLYGSLAWSKHFNVHSDIDLLVDG